MLESLTDTYRILDAAGNRTREGLRVIEDFVRFGMNDAHLSRRLKEHRHELADISFGLPAGQLLASRDTLQDVGTAISTPAEAIRTSPRQVVQAAFKRVQEALRTLEEYSKILDPSVSQRYEQLRYQLYTTEKGVLREDLSRERLANQSLYLLVTSTDCQNGIEATVQQSLAAGVRIIQSREKGLGDRAWLTLARSLREWTRAAGALLIMNDRPDLALLSGADGVHLGQDEVTVQDARRILGQDRLIGLSTHTLEQGRQGVLEGADYLGVGPTFPTTTKSFREFPGLEFVQQMAAEIRLPWFAIGGINGSNLRDVMQAGATRVAVSSAICRSSNPEQVARQLLGELSTPVDQRSS